MADQVLSATGVMARGTYQAQVGKALGEMLGGFFLAAGGVGGEIVGTGLTSTGIGGVVGVPAMAVSAGIVTAGVGNMAAGLRGFAQALMSSGSGSGGNAEREGIGTRLSQKQLRHVEGRPEWIARGKGSYFKSTNDAQSVLDAYHSRQATVLGRTTQGHVVVTFDKVTGFNNNPGAGFVDQPTSTFMIKGTSSPSVVPISPQWSP